jgi:hypothetical protein
VADSVTRIGEAVYCDRIGSFPPSINGYRYCCSFVDKKSRYGVVYFLKRKSDASLALRQVVKHFAAKNIAIGTIITDVGGEFAKESVDKKGGDRHIKGTDAKRKRGGTSGKRSVKSGRPPSKDVSSQPKVQDGDELGISDELSESFDIKFYLTIADLGIDHVLCPAHVPQSHGVVERFNRTVTKLANTLLFQARLSHLLWPEAFAHASLIRNVFPVEGRGAMSPHEMFTGRKPDVTHLKVWGCDCYRLLQTYPKIPGQSARKRLIYVGECPDRIGFKVLDPETMVFSSEFELLFNENSCSERMNRLMEHDARRSLAQAGKLHELPIVDEAYAGRLTLEQECSEQIVRNIFHSPHASERERKAESSLPTVDDELVKMKSANAPRAAGGPGACSDKTDRVIDPVDANPLTKGGELPSAELTAGNKSEVVASERCAKSTSKRATKVAGVKHMGIDVDIIARRAKCGYPRWRPKRRVSYRRISQCCWFR